MKNYPHGVPEPRLYAANPMAHEDLSWFSASSGRWPCLDGENDSVALLKWYYFSPLGARRVLSHYELTSPEIYSWLGKQDGHLERKKVFTVQVLMQAVVIAGLILQ